LTNKIKNIVIALTKLLLYSHVVFFIKKT